MKGQCMVQLGLIEALNEIAFTHYAHLNTDHLAVLLNSLDRCYEFSRQVNHNPNLRSSIEHAGLVDLLVRSETASASVYLRVLFRMYAELNNDPEKRTTLAEDRLIKKCVEIIKDYVRWTNLEKNEDNKDTKRMLRAYTQILIQILRGFNDLYDHQLKKHMGVLYAHHCDLMMSESKELRLALQKVFVRLGVLANILS